MFRIAICCFGLLIAGAIASTSPAHAGETLCSSSPCYKTVTTRKVVGYKYKKVKVPIYKHYHHKVKVNCCAPAPAKAEIQTPAPKEVTVHQQVFVRVVPEIHYIVPQVRILPQACCPPGTSSYLPPCPPGEVPVPRHRPAYNYGYGDPPHVADAALGTPGGGYVPGAPRNPQECVARGGRDTGHGCAGYH